MSQDDVHYPEIYPALREIVEALGGVDVVQRELCPDHADGSFVARALRPRAMWEFQLSDFLWLMHAGREVGCHEACNAIVRALAVRPALAKVAVTSNEFFTRIALGLGLPKNCAQMQITLTVGELVSVSYVCIGDRPMAEALAEECREYVLVPKDGAK